MTDRTDLDQPSRAIPRSTPLIVAVFTAVVMTVLELAEHTFDRVLANWESAGLTVVAAVLMMTPLAAWRARKKAAIYSDLSDAKLALELQLADRKRFRELTDLLQLARTREDLRAVLDRQMGSFFPSSDGGIFLISTSGDVFEPIGSWGSDRTLEPFARDECWSLRLGKPYGTSAFENAPACEHIAHADGGDHLCVPMQADGKVIGILSVHRLTGGPVSSLMNDLEQTVAARVALPAANLLLRESLRDQSIRDSLTGVFNRRHLDTSLADQSKSALEHGIPLTVAIIDLDNFKQVNDSFGHATGDDALREFGHFLANNVRSNDVVCRYGGEEFTLVLPGTDSEEAMALVERLRSQCEVATFGSNPIGRTRVTFSAGVASSPANGTTPEALLKGADRALYEAKSTGRNRIVAADQQMLDSLSA